MGSWLRIFLAANLRDRWNYPRFSGGIWVPKQWPQVRTHWRCRVFGHRWDTWGWHQNNIEYQPCRRCAQERLRAMRDRPLDG